jgi:peptide/nickel transport system substrate-binding protein
MPAVSKGDFTDHGAIAMRRRQHIPGPEWLVFLALLFVLSCGKAQESGPTTSVGGTVVIGILGEPGSLNPLVVTSITTQDIVDLVFLRLLVEEGDFLNHRPSLAEQWSFSADSLAITFRLRDDVLWHDGRPVTAEDVQYTWQLQTDEQVAWASRHLKDSIEDVEVVDARTVVFRFKHRSPDQLKDANDGVIVPKHIMETIPRESFSVADFGRNPVGCGPFKLGRWESGQFIELVRNENYYENGQPYLERVIFRIVPDMTTLVTQLKTGEIDCLESIPTDVLPELRDKHPEIKIYSYPTRDMAFIAWNLENPLLEDRDIRRALALAMNTREMITTLWNGMAEVLVGPMHPMLWAHDPGLEALPYDPDRARDILQAHGWGDAEGDGIREKDGKPFELDMTTNKGIQYRADVMTMAQAYLRQIGVKVNPRILEWNTFIGGVVSGDFDSTVLGWKVSTRADLTTFWRSTAVPPNGFNASRYHNAEVDSLIDRARRTLNVEDAKRLWSRCQRLIYEDQPIFFLAVPHEVVGLNSKFCDVRPNAKGFFENLPEWYIGENCP